MNFSIALINPLFPPSFYSGHYNRDIRQDKFLVYPLSLATVAGVFSILGVKDIQIIDENIGDNILEAEHCNVIGITGFPSQKKRILELAEKFKAMNKYVIIGGPLATVFPELLQKYFDTVFVGDAESSIKYFMSDFKSKSLKKIYYHSDGDVNNIFINPRYDLIKSNKYSFASFQTIRGCRHKCEFCAIHLHSGNILMTKPIEKVIEELNDILKTKGKSSVFIADDNSAADIQYFEALLQRFIIFQKENNYPFRFGTQLTIAIGKNEKILKLMAEAGYFMVFVGLESPITESLNETGKKLNVNIDVFEAVKNIQSYGISVDSGSILGFDNDNKNSHKAHLDFFQKLNIPCIYASMLYATPKTALYERLKRENRLTGNDFNLGSNQGSLDSALITNFTPKNMTLEEFKDSYIELLRNLYSFENFSKRLYGFLNTPLVINNEEFVPLSRGHKINIIKHLFKLTMFYIVESFPFSFFVFIKTMFITAKTKRFYIAFYHLVHFKQVYIYYLKVINGQKAKSNYEKLFH
ncbi:MAG: Fe-S oxidoreductase [uncultured bacterium]|nr:MAG: Fe-S oxidoreductase [uncultured bacterium]